jgi:GT2 family glycosyltransferase
MTCDVTILVVPRDRFSSVVPCVQSILDNTPEPFKLVVFDFGYPAKTLAELRRICGPRPLEIESCHRTIPMTALKQYIPKVQTKWLAWVDNDTFVSPNWLTAALERAEKGARVILPLTLERDGLDVDGQGRKLRVHISHGYLRKVKIDGKEYVYDDKNPSRRGSPEAAGTGGHTVDFFEFHAVVAETDVWKQLDIPEVVMREHIDLGIQLHRLGIPIWCEPKSVVHFDNIHTRPTLGDLRYFFFRWQKRFVKDSHEQFEKRWGYRFSNEQFISNWAFRRKVFSVLRYLYVPQKLADFASRAAVKLCCPPIPQKFLFKEDDNHELVLRPKGQGSGLKTLTADLKAATA